MLSYLHSFHAGNFADVLKHSVSSHILKYLTQKPKPIFYLDTHSGTGAFSLSEHEAQRNKEYLHGIGRLWPLKEDKNLPALVNNYLHLITKFNLEQGDKTQQLNFYPGSPWFAQSLLREQDRLNLFELHPREFKTLSQNFRRDKRIKTFNPDGFHACLSQLPPKEKRGYILIDPPYEVKEDYQRVVETLIQAHQKFSTGTYALWYPVVQRHKIVTLEKALIKSGIKNIQLFELGIEADSEKGMMSSGMIVINPPWTLMVEMKNALPFLKATLAPKAGHFRCLQLVPEA
jgi:23S rRNA (adenine2030-N6)-methyltransferase